MLLKFFVSTYFACIVSFMSPVFADTYTWSLKNDEGVLIGGTFATAANWTLSDGTVATEAPGADDDVVIPSGTAAYTVTASEKFNVKQLIIGDNDDASTTVTLSLNVKVNKDEFVGDVVEDIVVGAKGKITHTAVATTTLNQTDYKLNLIAGGDIIIKSGGSVNASEKGFAKGKGPVTGVRTGSPQGASHGGIGWRHGNATVKNKNAYGSIRNPVEPGSGGGDDKGGGVINLTSGSLLKIDGTILSSGKNGSGINNAAGGSIILKGKMIEGKGSIKAIGGQGGTYPGGGGGRIAIYTSEKKEFSDLTLSISAESGANKGSSGTIYFESGNCEKGCGDLIIKGSSSQYTYIKTNVSDAQQPFGKLVVSDGAKLSINDFSLTLTRGLDIQKSASISTAKRDNGTSKGGIIISPEPDGVFEYTYSSSGTVLTLDSLVCNAPEGATIKFKNSSSIKIADNGKLELNGAADNLLKLAPSTETGSWTLNVGSGVDMAINYVDISKCKATGSKIVANDSIGDDFSKENNWAFPVATKPGDPLTWTGASDTSWVNADNWVDQYGGTRLPEETDVITIPANCPNYPKLIAEQKVNTLLVAEGASINLSGVNIIVTNNLTVAGDITRSTAEKLIVAGEGDAVLDFGNREYGDVHITKSGGTIMLPNGLKTKRLIITSSAATTFKMPAGKMIEADVLDIDGNNGDFANKLITIVSSIPSTSWKLKVNDVMRIRGVNVSDSDASLGRTIAAGDFASNEGNNVNWDFTSGSAAEWVGGVDSNWTTPENWLPEGVPGEATVVAIRPKVAATITLSSTETIVPVGGIMLGGSDFSATLKCNKAVEVGGGVDIDAKGTLILNSIATNNIVNGNFVARPGSKVTHDGPRYANTQSCGVNILVKGDMRVEKGASINVDGKGFNTGYGPGRGSLSGQSTINPSYGGIGYLNSATSCYGSILRPYSFGSPFTSSGGNSSAGGGQIAIVTEGNLVVDGIISAKGGSSGGGTGGSILLKVKKLFGTGNVSVNGYSDPDDGNYGAAGGRIAIYLTEATSIKPDYTGSITYAAHNPSNRNNGNGTVYYEFANNESGGGTIYFNPGNGYGTSFPMADDGNPRTAYAKATVELSSGTLYLLKDTTVYDLNIKGGKINLQGHTLKVLSKKHKNGKGWANTYANCVIEGGGKIVWAAGMSLVIR